MTDPAHDGAVDLHPAAPVNVAWRIQRGDDRIFGDETWRASPAQASLLDRQRRMGACTTVSQARQLIFGQTCSTRLSVREHIPGPCAHRRRSGRTSWRRRSGRRRALVTIRLKRQMIGQRRAEGRPLSTAGWKKPRRRKPRFALSRSASLSSMSHEQQLQLLDLASSFSDERPSAARRRSTAAFAASRSAMSETSAAAPRDRRSSADLQANQRRSATCLRAITYGVPRILIKRGI